MIAPGRSPRPASSILLLGACALAACAKSSSTGSGGAGGAGSATSASVTAAASSAGGAGGAATSTASATSSTGGGAGGGSLCGNGKLDPGEMCDGSAPAGKVCVDCQIADPKAPVINEIVYDPPGDAGCYLEIYGDPGQDLAGYAVDAVDGSDGSVTSIAKLDGQKLGASGYLVLAADASVTVPAGAALLVVPAANRPKGPESVRLLHGGVVTDALGYGAFSMGQYFKGEKFPAQETSKSLCRLPSGKDTGDNSLDFFLCSPTPGAENLP
jgi:hypothetical protein